MNDEATLIGRTVADRYRVESEIARGGMASVYRARDVRLDRDVAMKVLASPYADDPRFTARFLDEARAAASLSHPSLVHVYDSGSDGQAHYIVMELLDRHRTLRDVLDSEGPRSAEEVLRIGRELLAGLRVVHERGLVHCDVKPANVMLGPGPAKLIDFGIATQPHEATDDDSSIGSLRFMSPEQLSGQALTPASDLFSLGAVLYQSLTGRPPYPATRPRRSAPPTPPAGSGRPRRSSTASPAGWTRRSSRPCTAIRTSASRAPRRWRPPSMRRPTRSRGVATTTRPRWSACRPRLRARVARRPATSHRWRRHGLRRHRSRASPHRRRAAVGAPGA